MYRSNQSRMFFRTNCCFVFLANLHEIARLDLKNCLLGGGLACVCVCPPLFFFAVVHHSKTGRQIKKTTSSPSQLLSILKKWSYLGEKASVCLSRKPKPDLFDPRVVYLLYTPCGYIWTWLVRGSESLGRHGRWTNRTSCCQEVMSCWLLLLHLRLGFYVQFRGLTETLQITIEMITVNKIYSAAEVTDSRQEMLRLSTVSENTLFT